MNNSIKKKVQQKTFEMIALWATGSVWIMLLLYIGKIDILVKIVLSSTWLIGMPIIIFLLIKSYKKSPL